VVGCGLAGLTVSIALAKAGHEVDIVEAAPAISYIGAGIQVSSNSSRILRKLGVDKYIEKYCTEPIDLKMMRWQDGQVLVECPLKEPALNEYGSPYWYYLCVAYKKMILTSHKGTFTAQISTVVCLRPHMHTAARFILTTGSRISTPTSHLSQPSKEQASQLT
jgi:hypothetical protein